MYYCLAKPTAHKTAVMKRCSPSHVQVTFTSNTVFSGVTCSNITNSNIQQPFSNKQQEIEVAFDDTEFVIDTTNANSRMTCYGCTMGAELVGTVSMIVSTTSCQLSTSQWAMSVRKFFDLVINVVPHVMSVDIGNRIEVRSMLPLVNVHLSDGRIVDTAPIVDRQPTATTTSVTTNTTATTATPTTTPTTATPTTPTATPITTAATTAAPTTAGMQLLI